MSLSFLSIENNTEIFNSLNTNIIKLPTSTIINDDKNIWNDIKSFFNLQNSLIILVIICTIFFFLTLCLVFILIQLIKKKHLNKNQNKLRSNNYPNSTKNPSSPIQIGLTSNQIASLRNITSTDKDSPSTILSTSPEQSFNNFKNELKRTWNDKGITSSNTLNPSSTIDDEIETVNEVLGMEERNGKVYYKVNFTDHSPDHTAWVCEEDLIPE